MISLGICIFLRFRLLTRTKVLLSELALEDLVLIWEIRVINPISRIKALALVLDLG